MSGKDKEKSAEVDPWIMFFWWPLLLVVVTGYSANFCRGDYDDHPVTTAVKSVFEKSVPLSSLQNRGANGYFEKNAEVAFTGEVYKKYSNGQFKMKGKMKNGKYHGPSNIWYEDGQQWAKGHAKKGKMDGFWVLYHENGNKLLEVTMYNGTPDKDSEKWWNSRGVRVASEKEAVSGKSFEALLRQSFSE